MFQHSTQIVKDIDTSLKHQLNILIVAWVRLILLWFLVFWFFDFQSQMRFVL